MISEIMDRRFVLEQLSRVRQDMTSRLGRRRPPEDPASLQHAEALVDLMQGSIARERAIETDAVAEAHERMRVRGVEDRDGVMLEEHIAYLARDPLISGFQSVLDEYFATVEPDRIQGDDPSGRSLHGDGHQPAVSPVTSRRLMPLPLSGAAAVRLFERFSLVDPWWVQSKLSKWFSMWSGKHGFRDADRPPTTQIADDARVVLVGDWASGLDRARLVGVHMRAAVEESLGRGQDVHVVHLGDTYFSGWPREYAERFLPMWPVRNGEEKRVGSWTLNGNHDMYSGGYGYYELLEDPRFLRQGGLSFFHLRNEHWDLLGLDTAYEDQTLAGGQARWVERVVGESERKTLLMSHHQPFSARNDKGERLREALAGVLGPGRAGVDAWFWGHEHRHAEYVRAHNVRNGRLVGHGGVPVWMWRDSGSANPSPESWEYRAVRHFGLSPFPWAMFGFAILDFAGPAIDVRYVNELGDDYGSPSSTPIS